MKNIFKDAYFGKQYKTRDGRQAIYHMYDSVESTHFLILDGSDEVCCDDEGIDLGDAPEYDIVSEWGEDDYKAAGNKLIKWIEENVSEYDLYSEVEYEYFIKDLKKALEK